MKKILFSLLVGCFVFGSLLFTSSCTKQYVSPVTVIDTAFNQTLYADLAPSNWATTDTGKNYTTTITPPTGSGFDINAGILIYFSFDNGTTYEQIPETYNNVSFTYTYTAGIITLFAQSADGTQTISAPIAFKAKIILVASE